MKNKLTLWIALGLLIGGMTFGAHSAEVRYSGYGGYGFGYDDMYYDSPEFAPGYMDYPMYEYDNDATYPTENYLYVYGVYWFNDNGTWYYYQDGRWYKDVENLHLNFQQ